MNERSRAFKAISPGMLPPLSVIFALLVGFLAAQVWSDADRAHGAVNREASALRAAVILAGAFPGETEARLRDLRLAESLGIVLALDAQGAGRATAQRGLVATLQAALDARRQRIILSESSINWVKWTVLLVQAILTLVAIALIHSDNRVANRIILTIFATGVGVAIVLIASHSRPFSGQLAVSPAILLQVMPETSAAAP